MEYDEARVLELPPSAVICVTAGAEWRGRTLRRTRETPISTWLTVTPDRFVQWVKSGHARPVPSPGNDRTINGAVRGDLRLAGVVGVTYLCGGEGGLVDRYPCLPAVEGVGGRGERTELEVTTVRAVLSRVRLGRYERPLI